jgi:hypothetical protein
LVFLQIAWLTQARGQAAGGEHKQNAQKDSHGRRHEQIAGRALLWSDARSIGNALRDTRVIP